MSHDGQGPGRRKDKGTGVEDRGGGVSLMEAMLLIFWGLTR